jgi:acyl-coenzyme A synthetase/AMP-(fatty) acid ligase
MEPLDAPNYAEYINRVFSAQIDRPVLAFPEWPDAYNGFKRWSPRQIEVLADKAATHYVAQGLNVRRKGEPPLLVAIHTPGTLEWAATFFTLLRMGHSVLVLSARLPDDVVTALLQKAGCETIIHERALSLDQHVQLIPIVSSARLLQDSQYQKGLACDTNVIDPDVDISQICHSSGSTGIPKLFPSTHKEAMSNLRFMTTLANPKVAWLASALYNIVGLRMLMGCLARGAPVYYDNDQLPFTTDGLILVMKEIQPEEVFLTP